MEYAVEGAFSLRSSLLPSAVALRQSDVLLNLKGNLMANWDESADFVIVGSGGGSMVAALAVADAGKR